MYDRKVWLLLYELTPCETGNNIYKKLATIKNKSKSKASWRITATTPEYNISLSLKLSTISLPPQPPQSTSVCVQKFVAHTHKALFHGSNFSGIWGIFVNMKWKKYFDKPAVLYLNSKRVRFNVVRRVVGKKITSYVVLKTERRASYVCSG